jgi:hypothetical protein
MTPSMLNGVPLTLGINIQGFGTSQVPATLLQTPLQGLSIQEPSPHLQDQCHPRQLHGP